MRSRSPGRTWGHAVARHQIVPDRKREEAVLRPLRVQRARYMTLETIAPMSDDPLVKLPAVAA